MSKAVVLLGDLGSDHEGFPPTPVIAGSPDVLIDGKPVARLGDPLAPHSKPKHSPHPRTIAGGSSTVVINGSPAAVTGSAISCGGVAIGSGSVVIGDAHTPAAFSGVSPTAASARNSVAVAKTGSGHEKAVTPEKNGC
ncbi:MAG: type VI secretion system PAAR protein [Marinobacter sp.]|nr:type VI secretion system PAAR protein [Marinobacter sp.]